MAVSLFLRAGRAGIPVCTVGGGYLLGGRPLDLVPCPEKGFRYSAVVDSNQRIKQLFGRYMLHRRERIKHV